MNLKRILVNQLWLMLVIALLVLTMLASYLIFKKPSSVSDRLLSIPIKSGRMINWFVIPNEYYIGYKAGDRYAIIYVEYPELLPNVPKDNFSMENTVRIMLDLEGGVEHDKVEVFLKHTIGKGCGSGDICYARLVSKSEQYEFFESTDSKNKSKYYYFGAYDGQHILLEDPGEWSNAYRVKRNINGYLSIDYQFPKNLVGNKTLLEKIEQDFIVIDNSITEFIKSHLKYEKFIKGE